MLERDGEVDPKGESVLENITEKLHGDDSCTSESDDDKKESPMAAVKNKVYRILGRDKTIHKVLGGGKPADIFLWRNKKISSGMLGFATAIWVLFEIMEYHLLTLVCHVIILALAALFLWSNASTFISKSPPKYPELFLPEEVVLRVAGALRIEINRAFAILRDVAAGKDLKKFLMVIAVLWFFSILGSCWNFLTLFYISFVMLHTVPVLYEKYEDEVDALAERAEAEVKKHYAELNAKVLNKLPRFQSKDKKAL
ncbi:hypothetical protein DCAR_0310062 [Daucus carota subsp. sativus]|uniref:Reticulon-like protein n=1 Tax=Daucus carota subsp. sativus TaxID=79200 RepID=A0AAF0WK26_DAUCS|nr:PREDICTED: reticulon-like protein B1 [Daucus carota subsp. sativus]WOG90816.1 hypothetical protein DCAR_0310062 [Daucus carota subsp. sativus]